jgi:hypothetical protein
MIVQEAKGAADSEQLLEILNHIATAVASTSECIANVVRELSALVHQAGTPLHVMGRVAQKNVAVAKANRDRALVESFGKMARDWRKRCASARAAEAAATGAAAASTEVCCCAKIEVDVSVRVVIVQL